MADETQQVGQELENAGKRLKGSTALTSNTGGADSNAGTPAPNIVAPTSADGEDAGVEEEEASLDVTDEARDKADELGVEISTVTGSGKDGRILVSDVERAATEQEAVREQADKLQAAEQEELRNKIESSMTSLDSRRKDAQRRGDTGFANGLAEGYYAVEELLRHVAGASRG